MSEILNEININDYNVQKMQGNGGGGGTEDLSVVLAAQDTALSTQETKIAQMVQALANKKSIDLAEETSDATATANDIAEGKTAYVNGVKVVGNSEAGGYKITEGMKLGYSSSIPNNIDTSEVQDMSNFFRAYAKQPLSDFIVNIDTSNATTMTNMFSSCYASLIDVSNFDTTNVTNFEQMFGATAYVVDIVGLENFKFDSLNSSVYGKGLVNMFYQSNSKLSNTTLNSILQMCINATPYYQGTKTLKYLGLSSAQATTCQTLSNWDAFVAAGWTSGY